VVGNKVSVLWQNENMRNHFNSSLAVGDGVYGFDESSEFKCLDLQTGSIRWSEPSLGKGSLIGADGKLLILGEKGQLVVAEPSSEAFKLVARAQVLGGKCWTSPCSPTAESIAATPKAMWFAWMCRGRQIESEAILRA